MKIIALFLSLIFVISCGDNSAKNKQVIENDIQIGMYREKVIELLGDPDDSKVENMSFGTYERMFYKPQYTIIIGKGKVTKIEGSEKLDKERDIARRKRLVESAKKRKAQEMTKQEFLESAYSKAYPEDMMKSVADEVYGK